MTTSENKTLLYLLVAIFFVSCLVAITLIIKLVLNTFDIDNTIYYAILFFVSFGGIHLFVKYRFIKYSNTVKYVLISILLIISIILFQILKKYP